MGDKELIYRLLYWAFLELRMEGHEKKVAKVFHIADLFHNTPMQLNSGTSAEEIMGWLKRRAEEKGMSSWLDHAIRQQEASARAWAARKRETSD